MMLWRFTLSARASAFALLVSAGGLGCGNRGSDDEEPDGDADADADSDADADADADADVDADADTDADTDADGDADVDADTDADGDADADADGDGDTDADGDAEPGCVGLCGHFVDCGGYADAGECMPSCLCWAQRFLRPEVWDPYFRCLSESCNPSNEACLLAAAEEVGATPTYEAFQPLCEDWGQRCADQEPEGGCPAIPLCGVSYFNDEVLEDLGECAAMDCCDALDCMADVYEGCSFLPS